MHGEAVEIANLTGVQKDEMHGLMTASFDGVSRDMFESDLEDKQWVMLLTDNERVCGFSTLCLLEDVVRGRSIKAFFSGDTIIDRAHWGSMALENTWARFVFSLAKADSTCQWYWFLICKGYRTYRYLPVYFKRHIPSPNSGTSGLEKAVIDQLATSRFGAAYRSASSTIHIPGNYRLRAGIGDISEKELRDPRIAFYQKCNPEWREGVELACLAELSPDNLTDAAFRFVGKDSAV